MGAKNYSDSWWARIRPGGCSRAATTYASPRPLIRRWTSTGLVQAAVTYYGEYRSEIDAEIALNEAEYERGRAAAIAGEQAIRG